MDMFIKLLKNSLKKRYYLILFIGIIVLYSLFSFLYFNVKKSFDVHLNYDIADVKDRIEKLENVLDDLKQKGDDLNVLINKNVKEFQNEKKIVDVNENKNSIDDKIGVLVMACNRPSVSFHIEQVLKLRKYNENKFPVVVSQDCNHEKTKNSILNYKDSLHAFIEQPDQSEPSDTQPIPGHLIGYYKISRHYKFALDEIFMKYKFKSVIITEDDLNLAIDFFQYFEALNKLLVNDKTLFCVSAWNDNGKKESIKNDPELLHRSDFFPGLGWMLTREFWLEIRDKWPKAYWDDWLRKTEIRKDRACIRPEISRTEISPKFGKIGVSNGQFFESYLKYIVLNIKYVNWLEKDISYLIKDNYDMQFMDDVFTPKSVDIEFHKYVNRENDEEAKIIVNGPLNLRIRYSTKEEFQTIARYFGIMDDFKDGVPRTGYKGVVRVYRDSKVIYISPKEPWNGYNTSW